MPNYEIMMIVDPKAITETEKLVNSVFKSGTKTYEKLPQTELAYEINGTKTANYILFTVESDGPTIKEFIRRAGIFKSIWRHLVVNLDTERAKKTLSKMRPLEELEEEARQAVVRRRERGGGYRRDESSGAHRRESHSASTSNEHAQTNKPSPELAKNGEDE